MDPRYNNLQYFHKLLHFIEGAHPFGMTNNCVPGGYNIPISTAPIIKSKKSSSLSSSIGSGISNMLEMAGNANEIGECMNEMGGNFSEIAEDCM